MFGVSAGEDVGREVEDVVVREGVEKSRGHHGKGGGFDGFEVAFFEIGHFAGGIEVGDDHVGIVAEVANATDDDGAVLLGEDHGAVLVADFLAGFDDLYEEVVRAELAGGAGEVGADGSAFLAEAVAGVAVGGTEHFAAVFEVALAFETGGKEGLEVFHGPVFHEAAWLGGKDGAAIFRLGVEDGLEFFLIGGVEVFDGGVLDLLDEGSEAGSAFVVGGAGEPAEVAFLEVGGPTGFHVAKDHGHRDLLFLGGAFLELSDGPVDDLFGSEVNKEVGEFDVFGAIVGWEVVVDLCDDVLFLFFGRFREPLENQGVGAEEVEAGLEIEGLVIVAEKGGDAGSLVLFPSDAGEGEDGSEFGDGIFFGDRFFGPLSERLFFKSGAGGEAEGTVAVRKVGPGGGDGGVVLLQMEGFEGEALVADILTGVLAIDWGRGFGASVGDTVEAGLDAASAHGEVKGAVISDGEVGEGEGLAGHEFLDVCGVGGTVGLEVHGVEFSVGPVGDEEGFLIPGGKLRTGSKDNSGGRAGSDVGDGPEAVAVIVRPLHGAIAPAEFGTTDDVVDAGRAVPGSVEVPLHVGVVGEEFAVTVKIDVVLVAESGGDDFPGLAVGVGLADPAAGGEGAFHEAPPVDAGKEVVLAPDFRDPAGLVFGKFRLVSARDVE